MSEFNTLSVAKRALLLVLALITLVSLAYRFYDLDRDAAQVSWSQGEILDPGTYLYNARSFALRREWRGEEGLGLRLAPGFVLTTGIWLSVFGAEYSRAAVFSVVLGFVLLACCASTAELAARRWFTGLPRWWAGMFTVWAMASSYIFFGLQQVPKGDMESMAVTALSALLLFSLDTDTPHIRRNAFLAGLAMGLAPFIKLHASLFAFAAILAWIAGYWVNDAKWRSTWKVATPMLVAGLGCTFVVWGPWYYWLLGQGGFEPIRSEVTTVFFGAPRTLWTIFDSNMFYRQPVELALATVAAFRYAWSVRRSWSLLFCTIWFFWGIVFLSFITYSPLRYRFLFVLPTVVFAAHLFASLLADRVKDSETKWTKASFKLAVLALALAAARGTYSRLSGSGGLPVLADVSLITIVGLWFAGRAVIRQAGRPTLAVTLIIPLMLGIALPQWIVGESSRGHVFQSWARELESKYPNLVLGGDVGIQVALWTKKDAYLDPQVNGKWRITHLIYSEQDEGLANEFPQFPVVLRFQHPRLPDPVVVRLIKDPDDLQD